MGTYNLQKIRLGMSPRQHCYQGQSGGYGKGHDKHHTYAL